jgi:hypothetical protein
MNNAPTIREKLISMLINELSDEEVSAVLNYAETLHITESSGDDNAENDPLVGFISGPTDLAERTEEILWAEFGLNKSQEDHG